MYGAHEDAGVVERVDDEQIVTRFFCVIVPVWPERSFYMHGEHATEIRPHAISIAAGLLRTSSWLAAFMLALPVVLLPARWLWLAPVAIALTAIAVACTFMLGRLSDDERARRRLLRRVIGVGAPPELLPPPLVDATRFALEGRWRDANLAPWFEAVARGDASELLAALADYSGRPDLAREVRDRLTERAFN
jgi:hypothetical protein